jgi:4-amino-4-deoxy-L-arabinose transferase-like glycosyltransferase
MLKHNLLGKSIFLWFIFYFAVLLCGCSLWLTLPRSWRPAASIDYERYYKQVALNILENRGLTETDGTPAVKHPPGHPIFLAGVFRLADFIGLQREQLLLLVSIGLHSAAATLLGWFASRFWPIESALICAFLWATYLPALWLIPLFNSETPFIPLFLSSMVAFWIAGRPKADNRLRYGPLALSGGCLGAAMLFRPIALAILPVLIVLLLMRSNQRAFRMRVAAAAIVLASSMAMILPWEAWMYRHLGRFELLSSGGFPSVIDGLTYARDKELTESLSIDPAVAALMEDLDARYNDGEIDGFGRLIPYLAREFRQSPGTVLKLAFVKLGRCWYATDSHRRETALLLLQIPYLVLGVWGGARAWRKSAAHKELVVLAIVLVLANWLMTFMVLSIARYMAPIMMFVILLIPAILISGKEMQPDG